LVGKESKNTVKKRNSRLNRRVSNREGGKKRCPNPEEGTPRGYRTGGRGWCFGLSARKLPPLPEGENEKENRGKREMLCNFQMKRNRIRNSYSKKEKRERRQIGGEIGMNSSNYPSHLKFSAEKWEQSPVLQKRTKNAEVSESRAAVLEKQEKAISQGREMKHRASGVLIPVKTYFFGKKGRFPGKEE